MKMKLGDLHEIVKSRGDYQSRYCEYTVGKYFLPIYSVRKTKDFFLIWTNPSHGLKREDWEEAFIRVPIDSAVRFVGNVASLKLNTKYLSQPCLGVKFVTLKILVDLR